MINNISLEGMGDILEKGNDILIFPHINPDGDALGSCGSLCRALRNLGKNAWVLTEDGIPGYISFMDTEFCVEETGITEPDICVCVDCSEDTRLGRRYETYMSGKVRLCLDHHLLRDGFEESGFAHHYYVDASEAAAAQIIFDLIRACDWQMTKDMAESIYAGIITDTGCFQYSNTTPKTHNIAAELLGCGIDHMKIIVALYQNERLKKLQLSTRVLATLKVFAGGRGAIAHVTDEMVEEFGATMDDAEGTVDLVRNIEGVEIAAFLKEKGNAVRVSLRAKTWGEVNGIAACFGGGGHAKAAGCTIEAPMEEALAMVEERVAEYLEKKKDD